MSNQPHRRRPERVYEPVTEHHLLRAAIAHVRPDLTAEELTSAAGRLSVHFLQVQRELTRWGGNVVILEPPTDLPRHAVRFGIETADGELIGSAPIINPDEWTWYGEHP